MFWFVVFGLFIVYLMIFWILVMLVVEFFIVFNDFMMLCFILEKDVGKIFNFVWGFGYFGGMIVFFVVILFFVGNFLIGKMLIGIMLFFGFDLKFGEDVCIIGLLLVVWYFVFILLMFFFMFDVKSIGVSMVKVVKDGFVELKFFLVELMCMCCYFVCFFIGWMIY